MLDVILILCFYGTFSAFCSKFGDIGESMGKSCKFHFEPIINIYFKRKIEKQK